MKWVIVLTKGDETDVVGPFASENAAVLVLANDVPTIDGWDGFTGVVVKMVSGNTAKW